jgi:23S rRNA (guanosine2251-2'-O)-methyltransferase
MAERKHLSDQLRDLKVKAKSGLVYGIHPVSEALKSGRPLEKVLIRQGMKHEGVTGLFRLLQEQQIPFQFVPAEKLNRLTGGNHQGIIAYTSEIEYVALDKLIPSLFEQGRLPALAMLDGITDIRNFGGIARSALCAGLDALVVPAKGSALINAEAIRSSSGALQVLPVARTGKLTDAARFLQESGLQLVAASEKADEQLYTLDLERPTAFILGSEDKGIERKLLDMADRTVRIPVYGQIESLNVGVAAAVLFYELVRQRF